MASISSTALRKQSHRRNKNGKAAEVGEYGSQFFFHLVSAVERVIEC